MLAIVAMSLLVALSGCGRESACDQRGLTRETADLVVEFKPFDDGRQEMDAYTRILDLEEVTEVSQSEGPPGGPQSLIVRVRSPELRGDVRQTLEGWQEVEDVRLGSCWARE